MFDKNGFIEADDYDYNKELKKKMNGKHFADV